MSYRATSVDLLFVRVVNCEGIDIRFIVRVLIHLSREAGDLFRGVGKRSQTCALSSVWCLWIWNNFFVYWQILNCSSGFVLFRLAQTCFRLGVDHPLSPPFSATSFLSYPSLTPPRNTPAVCLPFILLTIPVRLFYERENWVRYVPLFFSSEDYILRCVFL